MIFFICTVNFIDAGKRLVSW